MRDILPLGERSGGLVAPPADGPADAAALRRVLDEDAWRLELGRRARRRAEDARRFLLDEAARRIA
jgi:glycosyltransferase involved in cell wall biosynthesis